MPRPCGPCSDKRRNEIDRHLLEMEISGETYRQIAQDFGYSEYALRRHKENHLTVDLSAIKTAKDVAREKALAETRERELEDLKQKAASSIVSRLENAANLFDQLKEIRHEAATLLDKAASSNDHKAAVGYLRELRGQIHLMAEIEGKIKAVNVNFAQINIYQSPEWVKVGEVLAEILQPYPELKAKVAARLLELASASAEEGKP